MDRLSYDLPPLADRRPCGRGRVAFFFPLLVGLGLALASAGSAQTPPADPSLPEVVARVDGYEIRRTELLAQAQIMRLQMLQAGQPDPGTMPGFVVQVLDAMIGERLVYADLERRGRTIAAAEIERAVAAMAQRYGGEPGLAEALTAQGTDLESLRRQLRQNLTIERVLMDGLAAEVKLGDDTLRQYYDSRPDEHQVPERHKVRHILRRLAADAPASEAERLASELLALREQVLAGADFAALARDHSDDVQSRERGGELPWVRVSQRSSDFERAASSLGTVGQLSDVVRSPAGLHLIQLVDRTPPRVRGFEEMRDEIAARLTAFEVRRQILERVESLRAKASIEILL